jgi:hypothetical protein
MSLQGGLAIDRMCFLAGVSRAGFYRHLRAEDPWQEEMDVPVAIVTRRIVSTWGAAIHFPWWLHSAIH